MAGLFQVLWSKGGGEFKKAAVLNGTDGEPLIIPTKSRDQLTEKICTRPFAVDWDADGDLDLVVGNFAGTFYLFTGQGKGEFEPKPEPILAEGSPLRIVGAHSDPFVVDWDRDGDLDIVSGSSNGGVFWAENSAGADKSAELKPFQTLIASEANHSRQGRLSEEDLAGPKSATRVWVDDLNGDGKLDVLVGDSVTLVAPAKGLSDAALKEKLDEWNEAIQAASQTLSSAANDAKKQEAANRKFNELYSQRSEFMKEEMTGYVWLYVRK